MWGLEKEGKWKLHVKHLNIWKWLSMSLAQTICPSRTSKLTTWWRPFDLEPRGAYSLSGQSWHLWPAWQEGAAGIEQERRWGGSCGPELTQHWHTNGHCLAAQRTGPASPISHATLSHPLSESSKHLSARDRKRGDIVIWKTLSALGVLGLTKSSKGGSSLSTSQGRGWGSLLTCSQSRCSGLHGSVCSAHPSSIIHSKNRLHSA